MQNIHSFWNRVGILALTSSILLTYSKDARALDVDFSFYSTTGYNTATSNSITGEVTGVLEGLDPNNPTQLPTDIIIYQNQTGIPYGTELNVNQSSAQGSIYVNPDGSIQSLYNLEYDAYTPLYAHQPTYEIQLAVGSTPGNPNYGGNVLQNVPNYSNYYLAFEQNNLGFTGIQFSTSTVPVPWEYQPSLISILLFICLFVFRKLVVL